MDFKINFCGIACVIIILRSLVIAQNFNSTLINPLIDDIFLLKEKVDILSYNTTILNKKIALENRRVDDVYQNISEMFNRTLKNYVEVHVISKLDAIHKEQDKIHMDCGSKCLTETDLNEVITLLNDVSKKFEKIELKFMRLENLEGKLNEQSNKLDKFVESHTEILQQINDKLSKHQEVLQKYEQELLNVRDNMTKARPKLPMEILLARTSSSVIGVN